LKDLVPVTGFWAVEWGTGDGGPGADAEAVKAVAVAAVSAAAAAMAAIPACSANAVLVVSSLPVVPVDLSSRPRAPWKKGQVRRTFACSAPVLPANRDRVVVPGAVITDTRRT
jgi:hypothetical protein